jgi:dihydroneopterin aldolase
VIAVTGIRAHGYHGVLASERVDGQTFVVDVALGVRTARAAATDDLSDTVDYAAVAGEVVGHIQGQPYDLIETLAAVIADDALARPGVERAEVTVHKPQAPVGVAFEDVRVTIVRQR